jgi:HEPN domain-containing protein
LLRVYIIYIDDNIPYIHGIAKIVNKFVDKLPNPVPKEILDFFDELSAYCIKGRYTDYKDTMFKNLNKEKTKTLLTKTKEVFSWLLTLKK